MRILTYRNHDHSPLARLITAIELIRIKRQKEHQKQHPTGKRFTQRELNDTACPTYKNYLDGRSQRLPDRASILAIAAYLECTPAERDHLLSTAGYLPEPPQHTATALSPILTHGRKLMRDLQFPALLITRDYHVHAVCPNMTALSGIPPLETIPNAQRNLFDLLNAEWLSPHLTPDTRTKFNRFLVCHLKYRSQAYEQQSWYKERLHSIYEHGDLRALWRSVQPDDLPSVLFGEALFNAHQVNFNVMCSSIDAERRAYLLWLLPADDFARSAFETFGCQNTPDTAAMCLAWEHDYIASL